MSPTEGLPRSIHARLVAKSKAEGVEAQLVLERYALHRFLFRLSKSRYVERFVLKGAQLMLIWIGETARPTRDADLLGFGVLTDEELQRIFADICRQPAREDGMEYLVDSIRITPIREAAAYGGRRIHLWSRLGNARLRIQVDVAVGDAVTPEPQWIELPSTIDLPTARLRAYRPETTIAEKLETIVARGLINSRLKDYFDIYVLSMKQIFDLLSLSQAIRNTFTRRGTPIPDGLPIGMSQSFVDEPGKRLQWRSFVSKADVAGIPDDLSQVIRAINAFLAPALDAARRGDVGESKDWPAGGPWIPQED